jgi:membrane protein implicated in regulation of membrane protease activity
MQTATKQRIKVVCWLLLGIAFFASYIYQRQPIQWLHFALYLGLWIWLGYSFTDRAKARQDERNKPMPHVTPR